MVSLNHEVLSQVLNNHISIRVDASYSGYSSQYLLRLLRSSKLKGVKIGQIWLIEKPTLDHYIEQAQDSTDKSFVPK